MSSHNVTPITLEEEYKKNTGIVPEDIKKLREWLHTQPHLPEKHLTARAQKGITTTKRSVEFVKEGSSKKPKPKPYSILDAAPDWTLMMDTYEKQYKIPGDICVSSSRPDLFLYSKHLRRVILVELTVPWETNIPRDHTFKLNKYYELTNELSRNKFIVNLYAVEVGARDLDLILAFHSCDRSSGLTKQVLDLNLTLRTLFPSFKDRKLDQSLETLKNLLLIPLPMSTKEGYKINYTRFLNIDPKVFFLGEAVKALFMVTDMFQYEEGTWPGFMFVVDFEGMSLGHLAKIDLQNLQHVLYFLQEAMLVKLKGMHFINAPSFIDKLLLMMRPFLKKELMDMLHIHTTGSIKLQNFIPIEALPKEAGGSYKSIDECKDDILDKLRGYKTYFEEDKNKRVTEHLRPGKPKTITDIFGGVEGSFKKLDID